MKKYHVISNDEVYPFLPCYWPYKLFIEMSKKICASGFHLAFISLDKLSPPAFISPRLLLKANRDKKILYQ